LSAFRPGLGRCPRLGCWRPARRGPARGRRPVRPRHASRS